jgi:glycosyltransferase involved in cell wall biosynthesis
MMSHAPEERIMAEKRLPQIERQLHAEAPSGRLEAGHNVDNSATITACIVCRNEGDRLAECLESIAWTDEILVMDLSSSDNSAAMAREHGAKVISREPFPIVEPLRNELAAYAHGTWILALDPDERVTPGLAGELRRVAWRADLDAVIMPRMNWDLGYPPSSSVQRYEPQLRMYRRSRVTWPAVPNALPLVPEQRVCRISNDDTLVIMHHRSRTIPEVLDRVVRYAPAQAQSMVDGGQVFTARRMILAIAAQIDKEFFAARAWRDGVPGILRAGILVAFKFYVWAAFWQLSGGQRRAGDDRLLRRWGSALEILRQAVRGCAVTYRALMRVARR